MALDKIFYGVLIFVVTLVVALSVVTDIDNNYDDVSIPDDSGDFAKLTSKSNEISGVLNDTSQQTKDNLFGLDSGDGTNDVENSLFLGGFKSILKFSTLFAPILDMVNIIAGIIGIPPIMVVAATSAIALLIAFAVLLLILRIKG